MKKLTSLLMLIAALTTGCVVSEQNTEGGRDGQVELTLRLSTPGGFTPPSLSRALSNKQETTITSLYMLVFDNTNTLRWKGSGAVTTDPADTSDGTGEFKITIPKREGEHTLMVLANPGDMTGYDGLTVDTSAYDNAVADLVVTSTGKLYSSGGTIPMWGEKSGVTLTAGAQSLDFDLTRAVARVDVGVGTPTKSLTDGSYRWDGVHDGNDISFQIKSIHVYKPNGSYSMMPAKANVTVDAGKIKVTAPTIPSTNTVESSPWEYGPFTSPLYSSRDIYLPESDVKQGEETPGGAKHNQRMAIVIGGVWDDEGDGDYSDDATSYFRADFVKENKLANVLRNHVYLLSVTGVTGRGYDDPATAYTGTTSNMTVEVLDWEDEIMEGIEWVGQKFFAFGERPVEMPAMTDTRTVQLLTNITDGFTMTRTGGGTLTAPTVTGSGNAVTYDGSPDFKYTLTLDSESGGQRAYTLTVETKTKNIGSTVRSDKWTLTAGALLSALFEVRQLASPTDPEPRAINITASGGTVLSTHTTAPEGTRVKVAATPASGYKFERWTATTSAITIDPSDATNPELAFDMPDQEVFLTAEFTMIPWIEVGQNSLVFLPRGASPGTITITANTAYTVTVSGAGFGIGTSASTGTTPITIPAPEEEGTTTERTITVTADDITGEMNRGRVTITASSGDPAPVVTVDLVQSAFAPTISSDKATLRFSATGGEDNAQEFTITTNYTWSYTSAGDAVFFSLDPSTTDGTGNQTFRVVPEAYTGNRPRMSTLTFVNGTAATTVAIIQDGKSTGSTYAVAGVADPADRGHMVTVKQEGGVIPIIESNAGDGVTFTTSPADPNDVTFDGWYLTKGTRPRDFPTDGVKTNPITITMRSDELELTARYTHKLWKVTLSNPAGMIISRDGANEATAEDTGVVSATTLGYTATDPHTDDWYYPPVITLSGASDTDGADNRATFDMPVGNVTVSVARGGLKPRYSITAQTGPATGIAAITAKYKNEAVDLTSETFRPGRVVELTAPASDPAGYEFIGWTLAGENFYLDGGTSQTATAGVKTISVVVPENNNGIATANYEKLYRITTAVSGGLTATQAGLSPTPTTAFDHSGTAQTISVSPTDPEGYEFVDWTLAGGVVLAGTGEATSTSRSISVIVPSADGGTATANFRKLYTLTASVTEGVTGVNISKTPDKSYYRTDETITISVDNDLTETHRLAGWTLVNATRESGSAVSADEGEVTNSITVKVTANATVKAVFEPLAYLFTLKQFTAGGTVTPSHASGTLVPVGTTVTLTINPNQYRDVASFEGISATKVNATTWSFTMPSQAVSVTPKWVADGVEWSSYTYHLGQTINEKEGGASFTPNDFEILVLRTPLGAPSFYVSKQPTMITGDVTISTKTVNESDGNKSYYLVFKVNSYGKVPMN